MLDLTNPTILNDKTTFITISNIVENIVVFNVQKDARRVLSVLQPALNNAKNNNLISVDFYEEYQVLIDKLKWVTLISVSDKELPFMFREKLIIALNMKVFDLWNTLKTRLIIIHNLEERDLLKEEIKKALDYNTEKITKNKIALGDNNEVEPTVQNWIKDYVGYVNTGDKLKKAQYFFQNRNFIKLSNEEKDKIKILINLYDRLKISSDKPQGLLESIVIEDDNRYGVISDGEFTPFDSSLDKELEEIQKIIDKVDNQKQSILTPADDKSKILPLNQEKSPNNITRSKDISKLIKKYAHQDKNLLPEPEHHQELGAPVKQELIAPVKEVEKIEAPVALPVVDKPLVKEVEVKKIEKNEVPVNLPVIESPLVKKVEVVKSEVESPKESDSSLSLRMTEVKPAPVKKLITGLDTKDLMQKILTGDEEEIKKIADFKKQINASDGQEAQKIIAGFKQSKTAEEIIARLEILAQGNHFAELLATIGLSTNNLSLVNFKRMINAFLSKQFPEDQVARYAMRLAMILKKNGYEHLLHAVYFDKKEQVFRWNV